MATERRPLDGQVAMVTGAGRGIGAAIALRLADLGASLVLCGRTKATLEEAASRISRTGSTAQALACDVADASSVDTVARQVQASFGRLDILVNNAGIGDFAGHLHQLPAETWNKIIGTNLTGVYHTIRAFAPIMSVVEVTTFSFLAVAGSADTKRTNNVASATRQPRRKTHRTDLFIINLFS